MAKREELSVGQLVWSYEDRRHGWVPAQVIEVGRVNAYLDFKSRGTRGRRPIAGLRVGVVKPIAAPGTIVDSPVTLIADAATGGRWYKTLQAYVEACAQRAQGTR